MRNIFRFCSVYVFAVACGIPQDEIEQKQANKIQIENYQLKSKLDSLQREFDVLQSNYNMLQNVVARKATEEGQNTSKTDENAIRLIKDYYTFYNSNYVFRNPQIRKISSNEFQISLEECSKSFLQSNIDEWTSKVLVLTIYENGKYDVKNLSNRGF